MSEKESQTNKKVPYPLVFVTGIGQTWSTIRGSEGERWNLIPRSNEVLFRHHGVLDYLHMGKTGAKALAGLLTGKGKAEQEDFVRIFEKMFYACITDGMGKLPPEVDVRIYGARSFDVLAKTDFLSDRVTPGTDDPVLSRIYRDIPCKELAQEVGEENLYCFNYSPFYDLYDNAQALRKMIVQVIADQKTKTGADKVILVPMSMGATVVTAYLDLYYDDKGPVGDDLVSKIISIVGAWNGSDALADLLALNFAKDANKRLARFVNKSTLKKLGIFNRERLVALVKTAADSLFESVLLRSTSFMALIPKERFDELSPVLFSPERMRRRPDLKELRERAERYHSAQQNLHRRMDAFLQGENKGIYFISGYNMTFGEEGRDFDFLSLLACADCTNSDSVIQISSTAPGTDYVTKGQRFTGRNKKYLSPDQSVDAATCWYPERAWYFDGQKHELGTNNTALRLAGDIALGRVDDIHGLYPQFNKKRDLSGVEELLARGEQALQKGDLPEGRALALTVAMEQVKQMQDCIINNPAEDTAKVDALKREIGDILF